MICQEQETLRPLGEVFGLMQRQHQLTSELYRKIGDREQLKMHVERMATVVKGLVVALFVLVLAMMIAPISGQDATIEPVPDAPVVVIETGRSEWVEVALIVVVGAGVIGVLTLAYVAVVGLRDSFPPGTAAAWEKLWGSVKDRIEQTPNQIDDMAAVIAGPLVEAILRAIREREEVAAAALPEKDDTQPLADI